MLKFSSQWLYMQHIFISRYFSLLSLYFLFVASVSVRGKRVGITLCDTSGQVSLLVKHSFQVLRDTVH